MLTFADSAENSVTHQLLIYSQGSLFIDQSAPFLLTTPDFLKTEVLYCKLSSFINYTVSHGSLVKRVSHTDITVGNRHSTVVVVNTCDNECEYIIENRSGYHSRRVTE